MFVLSRVGLSLRGPILGKAAPPCPSWAPFSATMSLTRFEILFDNPVRTYYGGQQVTGHVIVNLVREKRIRGVLLSLRGEAEVKWVEKRKAPREGKPNTERDNYYAKEIYLESSYYVIGGSDQEMVIPAGEHKYSFVFVLPQQLPSSFEGIYGYVRYTIKAKMRRPWKYSHEYKTAFTVLAPLDLNNEINLQEPCNMSREKYLCCLCCRSGPVVLAGTLPFRGYVPGQLIEVTVEVENMTNRDVIVKCQLAKRVTFIGKCGQYEKSRHVEKVITEHMLGRIYAGSSEVRIGTLEVPAVPASYLQYCNCIIISYSVLVKGQPDGLHRNKIVTLPVVIGTIPLRLYFSSIDRSTPPESATPEFDLPPSFSEIVGNPPEYNPFHEYPEMPPPAYEECMLGENSIRNEDDNEYVQGETHFTPRYPLFRFRTVDEP